METKLLPCSLTPEELEARSYDLACEINNIEALEDDKKRIVADFKARIEASETKARTLAQQVRTKQEMREVIVKVMRNDADKRWEIIRADTGEMVDWRQYGPADYNRPLPLTGTE